MKKLFNIVFPAVITALLVVGCGKKPWENYTPPALIPAIPDPPVTPVDKDPALNQTFRVKIMSIGINKNADGTKTADADLNKKQQENADTILKYDPDIVLVRETDKNNTRSGADKDQGYIMANLTFMNYYFVTLLPSYKSGQYGFTMLMKNDFSNPYQQLLTPTTAGRAFGRITTMVNYNGVSYPVTFAGAQIDDTAAGGTNRTTQLGEIYEALKDIDGPVVFATGLYTTNTDTEVGLAKLRTANFTSGCSPCGFNIVAATPTYTGDHIMFKPKNTEIGAVKIIQYKVLANGASNRRAVFAEVEFTQ